MEHVKLFFRWFHGWVISPAGYCAGAEKVYWVKTAEVWEHLGLNESTSEHCLQSNTLYVSGKCMRVALCSQFPHNLVWFYVSKNLLSCIFIFCHFDTLCSEVHLVWEEYCRVQLTHVREKLLWKMNLCYTKFTALILKNFKANVVRDTIGCRHWTSTQQVKTSTRSWQKHWGLEFLSATL